MSKHIQFTVTATFDVSEPVGYLHSSRLLSLSESGRKQVLQGFEMNHLLKSKHALLRASTLLQEKMKDIVIDGYTTGIIICQKAVNNNLIDKVKTSYLSQINFEQESIDPSLFYLINSFPEGNSLSALCEFWCTRGSLMHFDCECIDELYSISCILSKAGRGKNFIVGYVSDITDDVAQAELSYISYDFEQSIQPDVSVGLKRSYNTSNQKSVASFATSVLDDFFKSVHFTEKTVLIVSSFLGSKAENCFATLMHKPVKTDLAAAVRSYSSQKGIGKTYFITGSTSASVNAIAFGMDCLHNTDVDQVIICNVDILEGVLEKSLRVINCNERPTLEDGSFCIQLVRYKEKLQSSINCILFSPPFMKQRKTHSIQLPHKYLPFLCNRQTETIFVTGLTQYDISVAEHIGTLVYRGSGFIQRMERKHISGEVFNLLFTHDESFIVISASVLGGTGILIHKSRLSDSNEH